MYTCLLTLLLLPLSWLYGFVILVRNALFNKGVLKETHSPLSTINVGNLTVGGTGKTPHTEYLIRLLLPTHRVAVLSRGYKRKTTGFRLADSHSTAADIGDEPLQMKRKFPAATVAVDANRLRGLQQVEADVVILDDAYQHRYVKPDINILLIDYRRPIFHDRLLPAGRLREPAIESRRADIVIVSKCPPDLSAAKAHLFAEKLRLSTAQSLFFTTFRYGTPYNLFFGNEELQLTTACRVLLLTGIAQPEPLLEQIKQKTPHITLLSYADHHAFTSKDFAKIHQRFEALASQGETVLLTTEKDAVRLLSNTDWSEAMRNHCYVLPIKVDFLFNGGNTFNNKILTRLAEALPAKNVVPLRT